MVTHWRHKRRAQATDPEAYAAAYAYLTRRRDSPLPQPPTSVRHAASRVGTPTASADPQAAPPNIQHLAPDINLRGVGAGALAGFWANFDPGPMDEDEDYDLPADEDLLLIPWALKERTAPWGEDIWDIPTPPPTPETDVDNENNEGDDAGTPADAGDDAPEDAAETATEDDDEGASVVTITDSSTDEPSVLDTSIADTVSDISSVADPSGAPLLTRFRANAVDLLQPEVYRFDPNAQVPDQSVKPWPPLRLHMTPDSDWLYAVTSNGVNLPRPFGAPPQFIPTRPSPLMDRVVAEWLRVGLLINNSKLKSSFPLFLIPKSDGGIRVIIDYSNWTQFIITPKFSLLTAGAAIRRVPPGAYMIKIDLKAGFHQLTINPKHHHFNGILYRNKKYSLTRLPMGHAAAPGIFQRACVAFLQHVCEIADCDFIAYLDDWLLYSTEQSRLFEATALIRTLGVTINDAKSILTPTTEIPYLGLQVNSVQTTVQILPSAHSKMRKLLAFVRPGSYKDRQRITGYVQWLLYNVRWPLFLAADIMRGETVWIDAALANMAIDEPHRYKDAPIILHIFTDATPHSIATYVPATREGFAQAYEAPSEISEAEMVAALMGLAWVAAAVSEAHIVVHSDNAAVYCSLRSGKGRVFRQLHIRNLFLSTLCRLRDNTWEVQPVRSVENPADGPSRDVLRSLHRAAIGDHLGRLRRDFGGHAVYDLPNNVNRFDQLTPITVRNVLN